MMLINSRSVLHLDSVYNKILKYGYMYILRTCVRIYNLQILKCIHQSILYTLPNIFTIGRYLLMLKKYYVKYIYTIKKIKLV